MDKFRKVKTQIFISACLNIGHILNGYSIGWSSPVLPKLQNVEETPLPDLINIKQGSWVGSSFNIGIIIGPYLAGYVTNKFGRKIGILLSGLVMIVGHVFLLLANNMYLIFAGRFIDGVAAGMIVVSTMVYGVEIASTHLRGILLTSFGVFHCLGSLLVYIVGPHISYPAVGCVFLSISALYVLGCMNIPESPVFHMMKGRQDRAIDTLICLGRTQESEEIKLVNENTKLSIEDQNDAWEWHEFFTIKSNRRSLVITIPLMLFQQLSGMMAALYFTTNIFQAAGSSIKPSFATILTGVAQFIGTLLVPMLIEKTGRKTLLLISTAGCCFSMTAMGAYFYLLDTDREAAAKIGWLPLVSLMFLFFTFSIGLNIVPNTLAGEMFRPNIRSIGSSLCTATIGLSGFVCVTSFGYLQEAVGDYYLFWLYSITNALAFIFTLLVVPETKGLSLSEIQIKLSN